MPNPPKIKPMSHGVAILIGGTVAAAIVAVALLGPRASRSRLPASRFNYDLQKYRRTEPALVKFKETKTIPIGGRTVHGIAVGPANSLYVLTDRQLLRFQSNGQKLFSTSLETSPTCVAVSAEGKVVVGFKNHVEIFSARGEREASWAKSAEDSLFTSVAVSSSRVFIADAGRRKVGVFDWSGKLLHEIDGKKRGKAGRGFIVPSPYFDVALAADGLVWITNPGLHLIEAYTPEGEYVRSWGKTTIRVEGFSGCCNPVHLALLPDGGFVTSEKGLTRIKTFAADGSFLAVVAGPQDFPSRESPCAADEGVTCKTGAVDIAVDDQGRIFALDPWKRAVRVFERIQR